MPSVSNYPAPRLDSRPVETFRATLGDLAARLEVSAPDGAGAAFTGVAMSTEHVRPGDLFIGVPGANAHGARFAAKAVDAGASAVLTDIDGAELVPDGVPTLVVTDPRLAAGPASAFLYRDPVSSMTSIGITGTQGKTTTAFYVAAAAGMSQSGTIGSIGTTVGDDFFPPVLTTPEAPELQALFAVMREEAVEVCAMEVSSHALVQGRVDGVVFDVAVFLNLGRDHLDFHLDVEDYYRAKASLFTPERARRALICVDDEHGRRLAGETTLPFGFWTPPARSAAMTCG